MSFSYMTWGNMCSILWYSFSGAVTWSTVLSTGSKGPAPDELIQMRMNHGIVGIIGWGLILPVGAIIARYFRHKDPQWFYLHAAIQFVGFSFGLATVLLGLQLYSKMKAHIPAHRGIGIFVLVLSILQVCHWPGYIILYYKHSTSHTKYSLN